MYLEMLNSNLKIKHDVSWSDLAFLDPNLFQVIGWIGSYCLKYKLPFVITSLVHDRMSVKSKSRTHDSGRAFDFSTNGINKYHCRVITDLLNKKFSSIAAISPTSGDPVMAVYGDENHINHIHVQVRPGIKFNEEV